MNEKIKELFDRAEHQALKHLGPDWEVYVEPSREQIFEKFAELIVKEMCGMMEQAEDDVYHCFEPSERPTEYVDWLYQWRTRFETHFGVK